MLTVTAILLAVGLFLFPDHAMAGQPADPTCAVPESVLAPGGGLPRASARLAAGEPLSILIVNSAKPAAKPIAE